MKQILLMIAVVALVGCGMKEPVQPSASNTEATKPEPTKAKAAAGVKLWEFETGRKAPVQDPLLKFGPIFFAFNNRDL